MSDPKEYAIKLAKLPDRIAAILGKTVAVRGDDFTMADDEALTRILDELNAFDDTVIDRNKDKRLARGTN